MGFYKPGANHVQDPKMARLHKIIWTLIFGGLLTIILGIFVQRAACTARRWPARLAVYLWPKRFWLLH